MSSINQLRIVSWNAKGICNQSTHQLELRNYIQRNKPDVILLQETFLNPTVKLHFPGYIMLRDDRVGHGGGTAIIINRKIHFRNFQLTSNNAFESTAIETTIDGSSVVLASIYIPHYTRGLHNQLSNVFSQNLNVVLAGDFNAIHPLWSRGTTNQAGDAIDSIVNHMDVVLLSPDQPTYFSAAHDGYCSTLDFVLHNSTKVISCPSVVDELWTDHKAIRFNISGRTCPFMAERHDYSKADWEAYRRSLSECRTNFVLPENTVAIDASIATLQQDIISARDLAIPKTTWNCHPQRLSDETVALIREKNIIRRRAQRAHGVDKSIAKAQLALLTSMIRKRITVERNANWKKFTESLNGNSKRFWRVAKSLRGSKARPSHITRLDGTVASTSTDMAEALADKFVAAHNQFDRPETELDAHIHASVFDFLCNGENFAHPIVEFTTDEFLEALSTARPFKAPGIDNIFYILVRQLPIEVTDQLIAIFNRCLSLGHWPSAWKTAKVVSVKKANASADHVQSYRPISLLSSLNKALEKLVLKRLIAWCCQEEVLPTVQFGFRAKHSSTHQAARLAHTIANWKRNHRSVGVVSLDVASAFDSVWHDGLLHKLINIDLDAHLTRLIASWLTDRQFFVQMGSRKSSLRTIAAGCPQGSSLSPHLFNIYTADLKPPDCEVFMFADDVAIAAEGLQQRRITRRLNEALEDIDNYYETWHLQLNHNKTTATFFPLDRKKKRLPAGPLKFADHNVEFSRELKYLGVTFDDRLSFKSHILAARKRIMAATNALRPLLARGSKLSIGTKRLLITQIIMPCGLYGSAIWAGATKPQLVFLRRQVTKAIKMAYQLPWRTPTSEVYNTANIKIIEELIATRQQEFYDSLDVFPNELMPGLRPP